MTQSNSSIAEEVLAALWEVHRREIPPPPWEGDGTLPWNEPEFSQRMLREHLDDRHAGGSRSATERGLQIEWLWRALKLAPGGRLLDVTCGPGLFAVPLAERGVTVTGVDFSPAAITHARSLASDAGVSARCTFIEADVRSLPDTGSFEAAMVLYGQLGCFTRQDAQRLLVQLAERLEPGGGLALEAFDPSTFSRCNDNSWATLDSGVWCERPHMLFVDAAWDEEQLISTERYHIIDLELGQLRRTTLSYQHYTPDQMLAMLNEAGFSDARVLSNSDDLPMHDAGSWNLYTAFRSS